MQDDAVTTEGQTPYGHAILVADLVGLRFGLDGRPDHSEVKAYIEARGGSFHEGPYDPARPLPPGLHFFYQPELSQADEIRAQTADGRYDGLIAAATFIPAEARFALGGVRIGAGTGNMGSASWGGGGGMGGGAVLMNTPGFNSRATAQMVMKAILRVLPDLPVDDLAAKVEAGEFDTGRDLKFFPTEKLEGKRLAVIGYGNIGREVARLGRAFGMAVTVHARAGHRPWIEAEGLTYAASAIDAAHGADVLSVHVGLGPVDGEGRPANQGMIDGAVLDALAPGAVLVNYDRGEVVDVSALDAALASGRLRHAAIDADLFHDPAKGAVSGPMAPYLPLAKRHAGRLMLLPHVAADTDHPSRVAGAKQAVDQMFDLICCRRVVNLKGSLPEGLTEGGSVSPPGIGPVDNRHLEALFEDAERIAPLASEAARLADLLGDCLTARKTDFFDATLAARAQELVLLSNLVARKLEALGLVGPYRTD